MILNTNDKVVVTGAAGFIGMHLIKNLVGKGYSVVAIDNLNPSYGGNLSVLRSNFLRNELGVDVQPFDIADSSNLTYLVETFANAKSVIHLAAWPGVRQGQKHPHSYSISNLTGFTNVLEAVRLGHPKQFMFASSSSVYGDLGKSGAVAEDSATGKELISYYAATKWANEILAKQHSTISNVPTIALRFFTVIGEFGRPDMAYWRFTENLINNQGVELYGDNGGKRNFTYVEDCTEAVSRLIEVQTKGYLPVNIAVDDPQETIVMLNYISTCLEKTPSIQFVGRPPVDVSTTWADQTLLKSLIGEINFTPLEISIKKFVFWFKHFQGV